MRIVDIYGRKYGRLRVESFSHFFNKRKYYNCVCDCGILKKVRRDGLLSGNTKSCGCLKIEIASKIKHGHCAKKITREYNSWNTMKMRCHNKNNPRHKDYGERGITVCDRWKYSFENFISDMGECPEGRSIDRKDNDKGYFPENCEWATNREQSRNTRKNIVITYNCETMVIKDWAKKFSICEGSLRYWILKMNKEMEWVCKYYTGKVRGHRGFRRKEIGNFKLAKEVT